MSDFFLFFQIVNVGYTKKDRLVFKIGRFLKEIFLRIPPPFKRIIEFSIRNPPPSKPQNQFEGGIHSECPWYGLIAAMMMIFRLFFYTWRTSWDTLFIDQRSFTTIFHLVVKFCDLVSLCNSLTIGFGYQTLTVFLEVFYSFFSWNINIVPEGI